MISQDMPSLIYTKKECRLIEIRERKQGVFILYKRINL
jgi:hypothetical protein